MFLQLFAGLLFSEGLGKSTKLEYRMTSGPGVIPRI